MPGGRPASTVPLIDRFLARREIMPSGCWHWTGSVAKNGYGQLSAREPKWGTRYVHRWAYTHYKGAIPDGKMIRHTCDNRICCNPEHLIPGDSVDNVRDMIQRNPNGCHRAFTEDQVREIRAAYKSAPFPSQTVLANRYGVSVPTIGSVLNGKHYGYVD